MRIQGKASQPARAAHQSMLSYNRENGTCLRQSLTPQPQDSNEFKTSRVLIQPLLFLTSAISVWSGRSPQLWANLAPLPHRSHPLRFLGWWLVWHQEHKAPATLEQPATKKNISWHKQPCQLLACCYPSLLEEGYWGSSFGAGPAVSWSWEVSLIPLNLTLKVEWY